MIAGHFWFAPGPLLAGSCDGHGGPACGKMAGPGALRAIPRSIAESAAWIPAFTERRTLGQPGGDGAHATMVRARGGLPGRPCKRQTACKYTARQDRDPSRSNHQHLHTPGAAHDIVTPTRSFCRNRARRHGGFGECRRRARSETPLISWRRRCAALATDFRLRRHGFVALRYAAALCRRVSA